MQGYTVYAFTWQQQQHDPYCDSCIRVHFKGKVLKLHQAWISYRFHVFKYISTRKYKVVCADGFLVLYSVCVCAHRLRIHKHAHNIRKNIKKFFVIFLTGSRYTVDNKVFDTRLERARVFKQLFSNKNIIFTPFGNVSFLCMLISIVRNA